MATATTTTTMQQQRTRQRVFPRKLGRFINLEGGLYGTLDIVALTPDRIELQTGEDFIRFDREQATNLRDTLDRFLALHAHSRAAEEERRLAGRIEEEEREEDLPEVAPEGEEDGQQVTTRVKRPRRRKSS